MGRLLLTAVFPFSEMPRAILLQNNIIVLFLEPHSHSALPWEGASPLANI